MTAPSDELAWQRLDRRMLLVHPITGVAKFIPVLLVSLILGTNSGNPLWTALPVVAILAYGLTRWFTTTYRVGPTHVELRTGLVQRKKLSVPRSRIRSVDIESDLLHRVLGLAVVVIGTGQQADSGDTFTLDSLDKRGVPELRAMLLAHTRAAPVAAETLPDSGDGKSAVEFDSSAAESAFDTGREIGHWRPSWVRYAPLSLTGFVIVAPVIGIAFQVGLADVIFDDNTIDQVEGSGVLLLILGALILLLTIIAAVALASCAHYLSTYFGLRVIDNDKTLHLRHGLFTTRQITLDLARLRGATVNEPLLLRVAGAASLEAVMTGENPRQKILPQAPRSAVEHTLGHMLTPNPEKQPRRPNLPATEDTPAQQQLAAPNPDPSATRPTDHPGDGRAAQLAHAALTEHGPVARRRRYLRALWPVPVIAIALLLLPLTGQNISSWLWLIPAALIPICTAMAEDRYRSLGHTVLPATADAPAWLITRSGSLGRDRDCLEAPGIIGWTVHQTWWQRRSGIATVIAATAAGKKRYHVVDIPLDRGLQLIESVTPGRLGTT